MSHPGHVRNFELAIRELAARGHAVHVVFDRDLGRRSAIGTLAREQERVSFGSSPQPAPRERWTAVGWQLRAMLDYLRYLDPPYTSSSRLRARAAGRITRPVARALSLAGRRPVGTLSALERSVRPRESLLRFLQEQAPDLVLVTPLVELGSPQLDYLRAAKSLGIPTVFCVASWDSLTSKGFVRELPSCVTVWNEAQRREAVELHGIPPDRVVATGAQAYDHWFGREPSRTSDALQEEAGLAPGAPYLLYVASSRFLAPGEGTWILRWLEAVRASRNAGPERLGILIRPHPLNPVSERELEEIEAHENVVVWPRGGEDPVDERSRADYFDSLCHARAVTGLNTSAMIEAAIAGRPVLTVVSPDAGDSQTGTVHFGHLLRENGGPAVAARSLGEHVRQIEDILEGRGPAVSHTDFLRNFVRPCGLAEQAAVRFVDALEEAGSGRRERLADVPFVARAAQPLLMVGGSLGLALRSAARPRRPAS